jgi:hypothetical protein
MDSLEEDAHAVVAKPNLTTPAFTAVCPYTTRLSQFGWPSANDPNGAILSIHHLPD